ncbi:hypothetical protein JW926_05480 [Candidatus Sumerlaeota bacterium]|nr:hypothetical protein [Candidatus Sumerlaeota bacterium]
MRIREIRGRKIKSLWLIAKPAFKPQKNLSDSIIKEKETTIFSGKKERRIEHGFALDL